MSGILIVDDEADIREMLEIMLEREGYETVTASNGEEAVKEAGKRKFDLIITDVVMPEMDGITEIQEILKQQPEMKVIAMSGGGAIPPETYLEMIKKLGAEKTFTKPLQRTEFLKAVKELAR
jgi:DNA-binding NtrC family response regulator